MTEGDRLGAIRGWLEDFAAATAIGIFLGLLGPFGSFFNGPAPQRILYWGAMSWAGLVVYGSGVRLIQAKLRTPRARWTAITLMVVVVAAPFGVFSWFLATTIWPVLKHIPALTPTLWYGEGLLLTGPQVALFAAIARRRAARAHAALSAGQAPAAAPGLLGAEPAEVLCLQMEDHYVRVHTAGGSRLVLATLAQAIEALGRTAGLRVHRSWWVADRAVVGALAEGRNLRLVLVNGLTAPVARSAVAAVRAAGWLERATNCPTLDIRDPRSVRLSAGR